MANATRLFQESPKKGKMTKRNTADVSPKHRRYAKKAAAKNRRAAAKRLEFSRRSEFGYEGHSSWWD